MIVNLKHKKGFTIVELLVSVTIVAIFLTSVVTFMVDLYRNSRRIELEEQLYQDMRALMRQITVMVETNALDYEEYFRATQNVNLFGNGDGVNYIYGDYAKQFYDFGWDGEGALCNTSYGIDVQAHAGCIIDKTTLDKNIGKKEGNVFCGEETPIACPADLTDFHKQSQLYLINARGTRKTFLATEPVQREIGESTVEENVLSIFWMNGKDTDGDDVSDTWTNGIEFNTETPDSLFDDLTIAKSEQNIYDEFIPISPLRSNIVDITFYISPLEDPYRAFAETDPTTGTLVQPHVTVILTMEPSAVEMQDYLGKIPRKTLQTTIYSNVQQEVKSY